MLDSILQRRAEPISFKKIITQNSVITDSKEIKRAVQTHFKDWTKANPPNETLWEEWEPFYSPLKDVHSSIYSDLLSPITIEELTQTIMLAPKKKAIGPFGIANEVL